MKRLILCFDGTWNQPDNKHPEDEQVETNVRRIFESLKGYDDKGIQQVGWYDPGVGTEWFRRIRGGAFGLGLSENIRQGYRYLIEHYKEGDEIFLFGFSRGAYTARALIGLIRNSGLLRTADDNLIDEAYALYRTRDEGPDSEAALTFRQKYARDIRITFLGVWDTVGALGIPIESFDDFNKRHFEFYDTDLSSIIANAYHAVALNEHREPYAVALWNPKEKPRQKMEQRWFLGAHSDVGGGYTDRRLSDLTLLWIQEKAIECNLALTPVQQPTDINDYYTAPITDSFKSFLKGIYSLFHRRYLRPVCQTIYGNEVIDESVKKRLEIDLYYRPKNTGLREHI